MPLGNRKYAGEGYVGCHGPRDEDGQPTHYCILGIVEVGPGVASPTWQCVDHTDTREKAEVRVAANRKFGQPDDVTISWDFHGPRMPNDDMPPM